MAEESKQVKFYNESCHWWNVISSKNLPLLKLLLDLFSLVYLLISLIPPVVVVGVDSPCHLTLPKIFRTVTCLWRKFNLLKVALVRAILINTLHVYKCHKNKTPKCSEWRASGQIESTNTLPATIGRSVMIQIIWLVITRTEK